MPDLTFAVVDAEAVAYAATPTILFKVGITNKTEGEEVQSIMLRAQIRLDVTHRHYDSNIEPRLLELFGEPARWGETLRSMLWTHSNTIVHGFSGSIVTELPITCTYDFEVAAAKYFHALEDGDVPLLFLFSGTVFFVGADGRLQIVQLPWESEASFRLPVSVWKEMMERYFPHSAWLRLNKDVFDRLYAYRARGAHPNWEATISELLERSSSEPISPLPDALEG